MVERVIATDEAIKLLRTIRQKHGEILLYQSGGCCDGSAPMCYGKDDYILGDSDIFLGSIDHTPFYMHKCQYDCWKHTQLIIDAIPGRGATFSLDSVENKHFITHSRVFTAEEFEEIKNQL